MLAACWRRNCCQLGPMRRGAGVSPPRGASAARCWARRAGRASGVRPRSGDSPNAGSRARAAARADAFDRRPADGPDVAAAAPTCAEPAPGANAAASAASLQTRVASAAAVPGERSEKGTIGRPQRRPSRLPPEHEKLMTQHQKLDVFGELVASPCNQQLQDRRESEICEGKELRRSSQDPGRPRRDRTEPPEPSRRRLRSPARPGIRART